jgi:prepilin-type N-terminal cleavage/methylation domain-containing protein
MTYKKAWAQTGFTIIELIVVIVVIGILAAITLVTYTGVRNKSFDNSIQTDLRSIASGLKSYKAATGTYPTTDILLSTLADSSGNVVTAAIPKISHDGYNMMDDSNPSDTYFRNLLVCVRSGGADPEFGIVALSLSGNVWYYTSSNSSITQGTQAFVGVDATECSYVGIASTDPGYAHFWAYKRASTTTDLNAGWLNWAAY